MSSKSTTKAPKAQKKSESPEKIAERAKFAKLSQELQKILMDDNVKVKPKRGTNVVELSYEDDDVIRNFEIRESHMGSSLKLDTIEDIIDKINAKRPVGKVEGPAVKRFREIYRNTINQHFKRPIMIEPNEYILNDFVKKEGSAKNDKGIPYNVYSAPHEKQEQETEPKQTETEPEKLLDSVKKGKLTESSMKEIQMEMEKIQLEKKKKEEQDYFEKVKKRFSKLKKDTPKKLSEETASEENLIKRFIASIPSKYGTINDLSVPRNPKSQEIIVPINNPSEPSILTRETDDVVELPQISEEDLKAYPDRVKEGDKAIKAYYRLVNDTLHVKRDVGLVISKKSVMDRVKSISEDKQMSAYDKNKLIQKVANDAINDLMTRITQEVAKKPLTMMSAQALKAYLRKVKF